MKLSLLIALLILCVLPLQGDVTSAVQKAGAASCNAFAETAWDNLNDFTQTSWNEFSADSTNDELDLGAMVATSFPWIQHDTATTDEDHCVLWEFKDIDSSMDFIAVALRMPSGSTGNFYVVGWDFGDPGSWYWGLISKSSGDAAYSSTIGSSAGSAPNDGDYISACIDGTGNDTVLTAWDHGGTDPGDCRSDWGTADFTWTNNPSLAVNSGSNVGWITNPWYIGDDPAGSTLDEFVGSDY